MNHHVRNRVRDEFEGLGKRATVPAAPSHDYGKATISSPALIFELLLEMDFTRRLAERRRETPKAPKIVDQLESYRSP